MRLGFMLWECAARSLANLSLHCISISVHVPRYFHQIVSVQKLRNPARSRKPKKEREKVHGEGNLSLGITKKNDGNYSLFTYSSHLCLAAALEVAGIIQR